MAIQGEGKADLLRRLNRVEGQVKGIRRMVEEESYCVDVMTQIAATQEALRSVGKLLLRNHLQTCVTEVVRTGDDVTAGKTYQELMDVLYKFVR